MRRTFILTALMLFVITGIQAQTLDKILEKHFEAAGHEKMADVKTYFIKAKMNMMGQDMPMSIQIKKPDKFKVEMEMMGQKVVSAYDGKEGWMINPMMGGGVQALEGDQLKQEMSKADMEGKLYKYKEKGHEAELIGKVNEGGKEVYRVKLTAKDGAVENYFIDANTYLISSMKTKVEAMGQSMEIESKMKEYQEVSGIMMPKVTEVVMSMGTMTTVMEEIKINEDIDDSVFAKPAN